MVPAIYPYLCIQQLYICPCKFSHVSWFNVDLVKPDWKKWEIEYPPDTTSSMSPDYRKTHKLTAGIGKNHLNPTFILGGGPNLNFHFGSFLDFKILREMYTSHVHQKRTPVEEALPHPCDRIPSLLELEEKRTFFLKSRTKNHCVFVKRFKTDTLENQRLERLEDDFPDFNWVMFRFHVNCSGVETCSLQVQVGHEKDRS